MSDIRECLKRQKQAITEASSYPKNMTPEVFKKWMVMELDGMFKAVKAEAAHYSGIMQNAVKSGDYKGAMQSVENYLKDYQPKQNKVVQKRLKNVRAAYEAESKHWDKQNESTDTTGEPIVEALDKSVSMPVKTAYNSAKNLRFHVDKIHARLEEALKAGDIQEAEKLVIFADNRLEDIDTAVKQLKGHLKTAVSKATAAAKKAKAQEE